VLSGSEDALALRNKTVPLFHRLSKRLHCCYRRSQRVIRALFQLLVHLVIRLHQMVQTLSATKTDFVLAIITLLLHYLQYYQVQQQVLQNNSMIGQQVGQSLTENAIRASLTYLVSPY
jgi:uncharacterized membrane protein YobD (UPF0266 family)